MITHLVAQVLSRKNDDDVRTLSFALTLLPQHDLDGRNCVGESLVIITTTHDYSSLNYENFI